MGYYSFYTLEINTKSPTPEHYREINIAFLSLFEEQSDNRFDSEDLDQSDFINDYILNEDLKWYDHEDDMIKLSKLFPNDYFSLYREGEESDDKWLYCFYNGKMELDKAKIVWPELKELYNEYKNSV